MNDTLKTSPFSLVWYKKFDPLKQVVADYLMANPEYYAADTAENYGMDIAAVRFFRTFERQGYYSYEFHEVESRKDWAEGTYPAHWIEKNPWIRIPQRKNKLLWKSADYPLWFWVVSNKGTDAYFTSKENMKEEYLMKQFVTQSNGEGWELFYCIPFDLWTYTKLRS